MEPLLLKTASQHGFTVRYSTELIHIKETTTGQPHKSLYECSVRDLVYGQTYIIRASYVFGADGARSHVGRALSFPYTGKPGGGKACNILFRADLSHIMIPERHAGLHWILKPDRENGFGIVAHLRMVRPWNEWILVGFRGDQKDPFENMTTESPELVNIISELIGDKSVVIEVLRLDPWSVRESVADRYDQHGPNVYLLGDAAHRHPPAFGLGSNTCVQDAYNLAWKVAYVDRGLAGPGLLASYSRERQPVGSTLVKAANEGLRAHAVVWESLGMFSESRSEGAKHLKQITASDEAGKAARQRLSSALDQIGHEIQSLGICYNQWYDDSDAVYTHDEPGPRSGIPEDPVADPLITTYPGSRLPHAWLDVPDRGKRISTHDLAGKGAFCLLFGEGGASWGDAAKNITLKTGIPINAHGIGLGLEYIDIDRTWSARREVSEDGCILVRPDRFVAWRAQELETDCEQKLMLVLNSILRRD
ncbi:unnamed protein product [Cercospora beticola]|nr:unnamed protein product [Cercospora beticola]